MAGTNLPVASRSTALGIADTNVSDEMARAGLAFGDLVERTGMAVAETQNRLTQTSANTAKALATTLVDVVAVQEKEYDDQGNVVHVNNFVRKLPLINFIDPVFYEWSGVRLQAQFYAKEFSDGVSAYKNGHTYRSSSRGGVTVLPILGGFASGRTSTSESNVTTDFTGTRSTDVSLGKMRMNALLRPRADVGVPKPTQVIRAPRLTVIEGEIIDLRADPAGPITERTMSLLFQFNRLDGTPIIGKNISIDSDGASWSFAVASNVTDANGQLEIILHRYFLEEGADTTPVDVIVTGRVGMVQNATTVKF